MTSGRAHRIHWLVAAICLLALQSAAQQARAADKLWDNVDGGVFNVRENWFGGVPGLFDRARFEITSSDSPSRQRIYSVDFTNNPTNDQLVVEDDNVTFDLDGHTYTLRNDFVGVALGTVSNRSGNLTVTGGTVDLNSMADLEIAPVANGSGVLTVGAGGVVTGEPDILVGLNGNGKLNVLNGGDVTATSTVLGRNSGSNGTATVSGIGSTLTTRFLNIGVDGSGTLEIRDGGIVNVPSSEAVIGSGTVVVGSNGALQAGLHLNLSFDSVGQGTLRIEPGGLVSVSQFTALGGNDALYLEGGTLLTGRTLDFGPEQFFWTSGTLVAGEFTGNLTIPNGGVLATSVGATHFSTSRVSGNLTLLPGATTDVSMSHLPGFGNTFARIQVDGNIVLGGGNLQLSLASESLPSSSDAYEILTAGLGIFGSFANVANGQRLATSDRLGSFLVNYGSESPLDPKKVFISSYLPATPGDFDVDGDVDGNDFLLWQRGDSPNHGNLADLTAWKVNFGTGASSTAGLFVAEPCSSSGFILASYAILFSHRCRRHNSPA